MAANQSKDELERLFYERALLGGGGDQVNVTNTDATPVPVRLLQNPVGISTEATLELVRAQTAAINANTDAIESILTFIRDEQQRRTDPIAPGSNIIGHTSPTVSKKLAEGKVRVAGGHVTNDTVNVNLTFTMRNPATLADGVTANTKNVFLFRITVDVSATGRITFWHDQTDFPNPIKNPYNPNHFFESAATVGELHAGNLLPTGGSEITPTRIVRPEVPFEFEGLFILPPGHSLSARVAGAATGSTATGNVHWYEE